MTQEHVDAIRPAFLKEPYTLGTAVNGVETMVSTAAKLAALFFEKSVSDADFKKLTRAWFGESMVELSQIFASEAPTLLLLSSNSDVSVSPPRVDELVSHRHRCRGLLQIRERLLDDRERISMAAYELASRVADRDAVMKVLRDTNTMTEDQWLKVVGDPIVNPPILRLLDLGIAQNAIWDLAKVGISFVLRKAGVDIP